MSVRVLFFTSVHENSIRNIVFRRSSRSRTLVSGSNELRLNWYVFRFSRYDRRLSALIVTGVEGGGRYG